MEQSERLQRFGRAVRKARNKLSQAAFAQRIGISQTALSAWERGAAMPDPDLVFEAERQLGIEPGGLSGYLGFVPFDASTLPDPDDGTIIPTTVVYPPAVVALSPADLEALNAATAPMMQLSEKINESLRVITEAMEPSVRAMQLVQQALAATSSTSSSVHAALEVLKDVERQQQQSESHKQLMDALSRLSAVSATTPAKSTPKRSTKKND